MDEKPRRFQFRLASLLWLMLVLAIMLGWYVDRGRLKRDGDRARLDATQQRELSQEMYKRDKWNTAHRVELEEKIRALEKSE